MACIRIFMLPKLGSISFILKMYMKTFSNEGQYGHSSWLFSGWKWSGVWCSMFPCLMGRFSLSFSGQAPTTESAPGDETAWRQSLQRGTHVQGHQGPRCRWLCIASLSQAAYMIRCVATLWTPCYQWERQWSENTRQGFGPLHGRPPPFTSINLGHNG